MKMISPKTILISRTDNLGDVIVSLPALYELKQAFPEVKIIFIGKNYVREVIELSQNVDVFVSYEELLAMDEKEAVAKIASFEIDIWLSLIDKDYQQLASICKKAKIPSRIYNFRSFPVGEYIRSQILRCGLFTKMIHMSGSKSHHTQYVFDVIAKAFSLQGEIDDSLDHIDHKYAIDQRPQSNSSDIKKIIIHPKSKGSAIEWGLDNFRQLIETLPEEKYEIFITGLADEEAEIRESLGTLKRKVNFLVGKTTLSEYIELIKQADMMLVNSTGPAHLAAALGINVVVFFSKFRTISPERWRPLGKNVKVMTSDVACDACQKNKGVISCACLEAISPEAIYRYIEQKFFAKESAA